MDLGNFDKSTTKRNIGENWKERKKNEGKLKMGFKFNNFFFTCFFKYTSLNSFST